METVTPTSMTITPTINTASPTIETVSPTTILMGDGCPCFKDLDVSLKYCMSSCCDIGTLVKGKKGSNIVEYSLKNQDKSCSETINGEITKHYSLTTKQYYSCDIELNVLSNHVNCTISDTANDNIFKALQILFTDAFTTESQLSKALIISYIAFLLVITFGLVYSMYTCIKKIRKHVRGSITYKSVESISSEDVYTTDSH